MHSVNALSMNLKNEFRSGIGIGIGGWKWDEFIVLRFGQLLFTFKLIHFYLKINISTNFDL